MSTEKIEEELKAALDEIYRPAPWLPSRSMEAIRRQRPVQRTWAWVAAVAAFALAAGSVAIFESAQRGAVSHPRPSPVAASSLPEPIPQPITRTSLGAQVAWVSVAQGQQSYMIAIDPSGRQVARLDQPSNGPYGTWRSADGSTIYAVGSGPLVAYSALDGTVQRVYPWDPGQVVADAFSPDGRWLAVLRLGFFLSESPPSFAVRPLRLQVIDLQTGSTQVMGISRDLKASLPGMTCDPNPDCSSSVVWGTVVFAPDSMRLYTLTDWGHPLRLTAFTLAGGKLVQVATQVDGQNGRTFPACSAPALAARVVAGGNTLVAFCHGDGAVWFFDLGNLTSSGVVRSDQPNPFWLSPIFTPDGHLLYLNVGPGFGDTMQVVDLVSHRLLGPVPTPTNVDQGGPFSWLFPNVYAGGVASTVPMSPDGLKLYAATYQGVMVLRVPDLKPVAKLAPGFSASEVWISGDGKTVYAISEDGKSVVVMRSDGSNRRSVSVPGVAYGFVASEHG